MTKEHALEFMKRYANARSYVKPSHLEELSPLLEVAIEAIACTKEDFHSLSGNTSMPCKETVDRFAMAAGISFNPLEESTRKEGDCYIGRSQAMVMGPDGKYSYGDVCEYEYDTAVRHEEEILADRNSRTPRLHAGGTLLEDKARLAYLSLRKVARQRANTGARSRAILSILGMQTGFMDLFRPDAPPSAQVTFLFSRIIVNSRNEMVLDRMLKSLTAPVGLLYGSESRMLEFPAQARNSRPQLRCISTSPVKEEDLEPEEEPDLEPPWEDPSPSPRLESLLSSIQAYLESGSLGPRAAAAAKDALENHRDDEAFLADIATRLKAVCDQHKGLSRTIQEE